MIRLSMGLLALVVFGASGHLNGANAQRPAVATSPRQDVTSESSGTPLRLPQPRAEERSREPAGGLDSTGRVIMSLSVVLGAFFLVAWLGRKKITVRAELPVEAVEVLGRVSLGPRETARLIRVGSKLLLVASTSQGLTTLTEVTDADEVEDLARLCVDGGRDWRQEAA